MMRKQNVQNVYDRKCDNQGKHETFKRDNVINFSKEQKS